VSKVEELVPQRSLIMAYYKECYEFDWLREYSDNPNIHARGLEARKALSSKALKNYALYKMYQAFFDYWENKRKGRIVSVPEIRDFIDLPILHPDLTEKK